jgi:hypothetical protein
MYTGVDPLETQPVHPQRMRGQVCWLHRDASGNDFLDRARRLIGRFHAERSIVTQFLGLVVQSLVRLQCGLYRRPYLRVCGYV